MHDDLERLLTAAHAPLDDPARHRRLGQAPPRFELYHFALSLCSQKVRFALAEKGAPYEAHDINLSLPKLANYDPAYVRLRLHGGDGRPFASGYTGRSSTETEGFDPAVVPTLVDLEARRVVVDSRRICLYVDDVWRDGPKLRPPHLAEAIDRELSIVDETPHVALFYGAHPDGDPRPERLRRGMVGVHDRKIAKLEQTRASVVDDPDLVAAFDAKIAKEQAARGFVATPDSMREAMRETLAIVAELETRLDDGRPWVCGPDFTLADVVWTISLFRLAWLGMAFAWEGGHPLNARRLARVASYCEQAFARPAFRDACIDWPLQPRSEHVARWYAPPPP